MPSYLAKNKLEIMVATHSCMLPIGTEAPHFELEDVCTGKTIKLQKNEEAKGYLVAFICNHCPFVINLLQHMPDQFNKFRDEGIEIFAISSNDIDKYPQDSPEEMKKLSIEHQFGFPYLFDENQQIATSYTAACTPDFFLFDRNFKLFYRGRYDASRPGSAEPVTGKDLLGAMRTLLSGSSAPENQLPSIGCNIKWKPDREPNYFTRKS